MSVSNRLAIGLSATVLVGVLAADFVFRNHAGRAAHFGDNGGIYRTWAEAALESEEETVWKVICLARISRCETRAEILCEGGFRVVDSAQRRAFGRGTRHPVGTTTQISIHVMCDR